MNKKKLNSIFSDDDDDVNSQNPDNDFLNFSDLPAIALELDDNAQRQESQDIANDVDFSRRYTHALMTKAMQLVDIAIESANDQGSPRNIEAAHGAIANASNVAKALIDIQEKNKKMNTSTPEDVQSIINNTSNQTINITSADLLKQIIDDANKETEEEIIDVN